MYVATIKDYVPFTYPVPFNKPGGGHFEDDLTDRDIQKWRNGVRDISEAVYVSIIQAAKISDSGVSEGPVSQDETPEQELTSVDMNVSEGAPIKVFSTRYERNATIRKKIIRAKGCKCCVCGTDFEQLYGELGKDFIHVHHNKPLFTGVRFSFSLNDFDVVCPNCHAMLHTNHRTCLTVAELKRMMLCKIQFSPLILE